MVTKSKDTIGKNKGRVKVGELNLNKETVKDLSKEERKNIKGGQLSMSRALDGCGTNTCVLLK